MKTQQQTAAVVNKMSSTLFGQTAFWSIECRQNPDYVLGVCTE